MAKSPAQLPLALKLRDDATFKNFWSADQAAIVKEVEKLIEGSGESFIYLWGAVHSGRTHLLQAACHAVHEQGKSAIYLPLDELPSVEMLADLEHYDLICLDDIEKIAGQSEWEEGLFHLYNRVKEQQHALLVASLLSPTQLELKLPDLKSRLSWGLTFRLHALDDDNKIKMLQMRAHQRGMTLNLDVAEFLLRHISRDMKKLMEVLDQLDQASLTAQRRLTIPFVKSVVV